MRWQHLISLQALCAPALAQSLKEALETNGFTLWAQRISADPLLLNAGPGTIIYAPTNQALESSSNANSPITRRATEADKRAAENAVHAVDSTAPRPPKPQKPSQNSTATRRQLGNAAGSAQVTLLDNPEFVNLGPGQNQVIVEKNVASWSLPLVFSGLGRAVKVTGDDIPYENGVIRPIDGIVTLPENVSTTLPYLGVNTFQDLVTQSGILNELDTRASITLLVPDDNAFKNIAKRTNTGFEELIKQHILVDFPAYTPLLENGDVYPTLAGGNVTVLIRDGVVYLNGAQILVGDAIVTNGVVHVIDKVLGGSPAVVPPTVTAAASAAMGPMFWEVLVCGFGVVAATRFFNLV